MTVVAPRVVVVGASIGGLTVAETLRQDGFDGEIVLVGSESHLPYTRPPLSKQILLGDWDAGQVAIREASEIADLAIDLRTSCTAVGLDVESRVLETTDGSFPFDELVIATGSEPRRHPVIPDAHVLRTLDDAVRLRDDLWRARRVAVVGSGILGSEIASAARHFDAETTIIGRSGRLGFGGVGTLLSDPLTVLHRDHGVQLELDVAIERVDRHGAETEIVSATGARGRFDLVVSMIGGAPRTSWLSSSSLTLDDGVVCDAGGRAAPGVWAVGDVASWEDPISGRHIRVEHQSNAIEQALAVSSRILRDETAAPPIPLFWSEIHGTRIHAYGWFDQDSALVGDTTSATPTAVLTCSTGDRITGVVGWNAPPRQFRQARALVTPTPAHAA